MTIPRSDDLSTDLLEDFRLDAAEQFPRCEQLLIELVAKIIYLRGSLSLIELAQQLRLSAMIVERICEFMRTERMVELLRRGATNGDADSGLTEPGRSRATEFLRKCRYAGPAPVTLTAGHGDLLVMGGACQHRWQHCVPKTRRPVGPRVAPTFRHVPGDNYDRPPG